MWFSVVKDWVSSKIHTMPNNLGPTAIHAIGCLTMSTETYSNLETCTMLGMM